MAKAINLKKITYSIKIFTHISTIIILLMTNRLLDIPIVFSFVGGILLASYLRQYFVNTGKSAAYIWISFAVELALIIALGFFDQSNTGILFFFVSISEAAIYYELKFPLLMMVPFLVSRYFVGTIQAISPLFTERILYVLLLYGVPAVFVLGMSCIVRIQVREKDKLAKVNAELEGAYKGLLESAAASEQLSVEKERVRMAREIHDTLAHTLTTLIVQLEACKKLSRVDTARMEAELEKAQELTRSGLNDVKRTIKSLRPQALEEKPFFESVLDLVNNTMNLAGAHIIFDNDLPQELKLPAAYEVAIFRLIQESMTNSIRHGAATEIHLWMGVDSGRIRIHIRDNGNGCGKIKKGFGLHGIEERVEAMGGSVAFISAAGKGFETKVSLPLEEEGIGR